MMRQAVSGTTGTTGTRVRLVRRARLGIALAAALASAACFDFTSTVTAPTGSTGATASLLGGWSSTQSAGGTQSCTNFKWSVTQTSGNTATGTFSATCFGNVSVNGSASGSLSNAVLTWTASATASVPNVTTCQIQLSGTAQLVGDTIQIPYTGTSCLGNLNGTETLK